MPSSVGTQSDESDGGGEGDAFKRRQGRKPTLAPKDRFYLALRGLRTGESHALLGERFGVSRQVASRYFSQGLKVLIDNLVPEFLVIPTEDVITARSSSDWVLRLATTALC